MAYRRMIHSDVICHDSFIDMTFEAQALFFQLQIRADEFGFVQSPRSALRTMGASSESLEELIRSGFVIRFHSGVIVMTHWNVANTRRSDRIAKIRFPEEYAHLCVSESGVYSVRDDNGNPMASQRDDNGNPSLSISPSISINQAEAEASERASSSSSDGTHAHTREDDDDDDDALKQYLLNTSFLEGTVDKVLEYRGRLSDDMIQYGVERAKEYGAHSFKYLAIILDGFIDKGITSIEAAEASQRERESAKVHNPKSSRYDPNAYVDPEHVFG